MVRPMNTSHYCEKKWYESLHNSPRCMKEPGHDGDHSGCGMTWSETPKVDQATAQVFLNLYRRIPNSYHDIKLQEDGTVIMSLGGFRAATQFIHVRYGDD